MLHFILLLGTICSGLNVDVYFFLLFFFSFPSCQPMVKFPYDELSANLSYDIQQNLLRINVKMIKMVELLFKSAER